MNNMTEEQGEAQVDTYVPVTETESASVDVKPATRKPRVDKGMKRVPKAKKSVVKKRKSRSPVVLYYWLSPIEANEANEATGGANTNERSHLLLYNSSATNSFDGTWVDSSDVLAEDIRELHRLPCTKVKDAVREVLALSQVEANRATHLGHKCQIIGVMDEFTIAGTTRVQVKAERG